MTVSPNTPIQPSSSPANTIPGIVLPTLTGETQHDQTEVRHALLDMNKNLQSIQNNIQSNSSSANTPLKPLSSAPSGNITFQAPTTAGIYMVYIPVGYLVATSGGPYMLIIQSSVMGRTVSVPIGASGNTISSGDLLFNIYIDSSGNVTSNAWEIAGSNANGSYEQRSNGEMACFKYQLSVAGGAHYTWTFPVAFNNTSYSVPACGGNIASGNFILGTDATTRYTYQVEYYCCPIGGTGTAIYDLVAFGRWRT